MYQVDMMLFIHDNYDVVCSAPRIIVITHHSYREWTTPYQVFWGLQPVVCPTFLADLTNGRAYATVLRPSSYVTLCIVAKRCVLEQK